MSYQLLIFTLVKRLLILRNRVFSFNLSSVDVLISGWTLRKNSGGGVDICGRVGVNEEDGMMRDLGGSY